MPNAPVPASAISLPFSSRPPRRRRKDLAADVSHWQPPAPATPRAALESAIEAAIALLDAAEPDPDLEDEHDQEADTADEEPSLGASNDYHGSSSQALWGAGAPSTAWDTDREGPEDDPEPSLGALNTRVDQTSWGHAGNGRDLEDEHDGMEPDGDGEPSHGSTSAMNQEHAWAPTDHFWGSGEGEPSLALTNIPAMLPRGYDRDREYDVADAPHDAEDDCDDAERSGERPDSLAPCLDQRAQRDAYKGIVHHPRALKAIAREQRAMQRTATRLRKIVKRLQERA